MADIDSRNGTLPCSAGSRLSLFTSPFTISNLNADGKNNRDKAATPLLGQSVTRNYVMKRCRSVLNMCAAADRPIT